MLMMIYIHHPAHLVTEVDHHDFNVDDDNEDIDKVECDNVDEDIDKVVGGNDDDPNVDADIELMVKMTIGST